MALTTKYKPSQKRKAESAFADSDSKNAPPVTKKISSTKLINKKFDRPVALLNDVELAEIPQPDLLAYTIALTKQLKAKPMTSSPASELTPQDLTKKVNHLRTLMERQIRKSMTWKPSCKTGSASFSQDFIVQSEQVLNALFKPVVKEGAKPWKMKKLSVDDFEKMVGQSIDASVRYANLYITSDVTIRWNADDATMKCSGKYGKFVGGG